MPLEPPVISTTFPFRFKGAGDTKTRKKRTKMMMRVSKTALVMRRGRGAEAIEAGREIGMI